MHLFPLGGEVYIKLESRIRISNELNRRRSLPAPPAYPSIHLGVHEIDISRRRLHRSGWCDGCAVPQSHLRSRVAFVCFREEECRMIYSVFTQNWLLPNREPRLPILDHTLKTIHTNGFVQIFLNLFGALRYHLEWKRHVSKIIVPLFFV